MASDKKRGRSPAPDTDDISLAPSIRAFLLGRCDVSAIPDFWREAAVSAGTANADEFMCHLGRSFSKAISSVHLATETSRSQLRETRATLHAAVDLRCDELEQGIANAESTEIAALEQKLELVDSSLIRWRSERSAVSEAASTLCDSELVAKHASLVARLTDLETLLRTLPTALLEVPHLRISFDTHSLVAAIAGYGSISTPIHSAFNHAKAAAGELHTAASSGDVPALRRCIAYGHSTEEEDKVRLTMDVVGWLGFCCARLIKLCTFLAPNCRTVTRH